MWMEFNMAKNFTDWTVRIQSPFLLTLQNVCWCHQHVAKQVRRKLREKIYFGLTQHRLHNNLSSEKPVGEGMSHFSCFCQWKIMDRPMEKNTYVTGCRLLSCRVNKIQGSHCCQVFFCISELTVVFQESLMIAAVYGDIFDYSNCSISLTPSHSCFFSAAAKCEGFSVLELKCVIWLHLSVNRHGDKSCFKTLLPDLCPKAVCLLTVHTLLYLFILTHLTNHQMGMNGRFSDSDRYNNCWT